MSATIDIGSYSFTTNDALRTFANLGELWNAQMKRRSSGDAVALGDALAGRLAAALDADGTGPATATDLHDLGVRAAGTLKNSPDLEELLTDVWVTLRQASDVLRAAGQMPATVTGSVVQVSASSGGVPKIATASAAIGFRGVDGDIQRVRIHHGRPWQALCLYADEVIDMLRAEGHPIGRGSVGENLTVRGLPWADVRPGVLLRIGTVIAHVQAYAEPCNTNSRFFLDGDFQRMNIDRGPVSRVYATVLQPGHVGEGDLVTLEPSGLDPIATLR